MTLISLLPWAFWLLVATSIQTIWFRSDFVCLVAKILRGLGWRRSDTAFWDIDAIEWKFWIRDQWAVWAERHFSWWLVHLLTCPVCFSCHLSYLAGLGAGLQTGSWQYGVAATLTYPYCIQFLFARLSTK